MAQRPDDDLTADRVALHDAEGLLDRVRGWVDVHRHIDEAMFALAEQVVQSEAGALFEMIDRSVLDGDRLPDAIDHDAVFLHPNPHRTAEQEEVLGLLDLLQGPQVPTVTAHFAEYATEHKLFERVLDGETFILPSNHLELQDQGLTLGYLHRVAKDQGVDRLENDITLMIGRLLGFLRLGHRNVIDDILRKAAGVLKTFPVSGGEVMDENVITEADLDHRLRLFRRTSNERTRREFERITRSSEGGIILLAGGGSRDFRDERGDVHMNPFGRSTRGLIADACSRGAWVVPLFVDYDVDTSLVELAEPVQPTDDAAVHHVGELIAAMGNMARGVARAEHPDIERFTRRIFYEAR
ncbi:MAG: hypothetical protein KDB35_13480 [Acidimicrobiales bacterium]|nr:hypothetical protein [Acidimicrobiales bacterium]MCB1013741.1 hypothetical protein [Acidimicrobiales bacterium]MCB9372188.1 hypothetical protein [Microthrixaceae bacterium]